MSCSLPPDVLGLVVDHLRDEPTALKACCLVSKLWVPWARKHLFAHIDFNPDGPSIESWMRAFPDPSRSPAHYAYRLSIRTLLVTPAQSPNPEPWLRAFHRIKMLRVETIRRDDSQIHLTPLHGLSSTLESLSVINSGTPISEVLGLICSFPSLKDLTLFSEADDSDPADRWVIPLTSPKLTGALQLAARNRTIVQSLLHLPGGLRFREIGAACFDADAIEAITDLVLKCCDTLETVNIMYPFPSTFNQLL